MASAIARCVLESEVCADWLPIGLLLFTNVATFWRDVDAVRNRQNHRGASSSAPIGSLQIDFQKPCTCATAIPTKAFSVATMDWKLKD